MLRSKPNVCIACILILYTKYTPVVLRERERIGEKEGEREGKRERERGGERERENHKIHIYI